MLAHVGCLHTRRSLRAFEVCSGFHGWTYPEFYRPLLLLGFHRFHFHDCVVFTTCLCDGAYQTVRVLSARRRRGLRFGSQTIVRLRVLLSPM